MQINICSCGMFQSHKLARKEEISLRFFDNDDISDDSFYVSWYKSYKTINIWQLIWIFLVFLSKAVAEKSWEWHLVDQTQSCFSKRRLVNFHSFQITSHGSSKGCTGGGRAEGVQHVSVSVGHHTTNQLKNWGIRICWKQSDAHLIGVLPNTKQKLNQHKGYEIPSQAQQNKIAKCRSRNLPRFIPQDNIIACKRNVW